MIKILGGSMSLIVVVWQTVVIEIVSSMVKLALPF